MADKRCGKCDQCKAKPPRPCRRWVESALRKLKQELESPALAEALNAWVPPPPPPPSARDPKTLLGRWRLPSVQAVVKVLHADDEYVLVVYEGQNRRANLETPAFCEALQQPGTIYLGSGR